MYTYLVKFTYKSKEYSCSFQNYQNFDEQSSEQILADLAKEAACQFIDANKLREANVFIGELRLYKNNGEKLLWEKK